MRSSRLAARPRISLIFFFAVFTVFVLPSDAQNTSGNPFKTSAPDPLAGPNEGLRTPADYEAALAALPDPSGKVFVSRCRFAPFSNSTSIYRPFAGTQTSDAIIGDTQFFFADGTHCFFQQNEANIVVNPTNSSNVVASANEYRIDGDEVYVSMDGGQTFTDVVPPGRTGATGGQGVFARLSMCGDPALAFAPDGTLYFASLGCNFKLHSTAGALPVSALSVSVSHDGGMTWSSPHLVTFTDANIIFNDKDWISVGPDGTVFVTWTRFETQRFGFGSSPIVMSISRDGGNTWSDFTPVSDASHQFNQGSQPLVAPDGTVYVAYEGCDGKQRILFLWGRNQCGPLDRWRQDFH